MHRLFCFQRVTPYSLLLKYNTTTPLECCFFLGLSLLSRKLIYALPLPFLRVPQGIAATRPKVVRACDGLKMPCLQLEMNATNARDVFSVNTALHGC